MSGRSLVCFRVKPIRIVEGLTEGDPAEALNLSAAAAINGEYELYTDQLKQRCIGQYKDGSLDMEQLGSVDGLGEFVSEALWASDPVTVLSVFTSMPVIWDLELLYPIVPIHRLDQWPGVDGVLYDLTCDKGEKFDKYFGRRSSLPLLEMQGEDGISGKGGKYFLGLFLCGLHNLFGSPSVAKVSQSDGSRSCEVPRAMCAPSSSDVLRVMQHEPEVIFETLKHNSVEDCVHLDSEVVNASAITSGHTSSTFNNMPCLITCSTCCITTDTSSYRYYYNGVLSDLTCGSDEKVDKFIGRQSSLQWRKIFLGVVLMRGLSRDGLHNLFGGPVWPGFHL